MIRSDGMLTTFNLELVGSQHLHPTFHCLKLWGVGGDVSQLIHLLRNGRWGMVGSYQTKPTEPDYTTDKYINNRVIRLLAVYGTFVTVYVWGVSVRLDILDVFTALCARQISETFVGPPLRYRLYTNTPRPPSTVRATGGVLFYFCFFYSF